jgi:hypothetical protein
MPKDESDPEDPLELCGVGLLTEEDTSEPMAECFIEEFLRLGHNHKQILALFRNPHYTGLKMVLQNRGEQFVKDKIAEVFGWWKRPVTWAGQSSAGVPPVSSQRASGVPPEDPASLSASAVGDGLMREQSGSEESVLPAGCRQHVQREGRRDACTTSTDPMGNVIPPLD